MHGFLGFDGGGTKTDCVLLREDGEMAGRGRSGPANPYRIGVDAAVQAMEAAAMQALAEAGGSESAVAALCAGLAGVGDTGRREAVRARLAHVFPSSLVLVMTDLEIALASLAEGAAIVLVAGTGSAAIGRNAAGQTARAGGHGPWFGDEGSAFDIGRAAIRGALEHRDRTGTDTPLGEQILLQLGEPDWDRLAARAAAAPDEVFPKVFPVVAAAADSGDQATRVILQRAAAGLGDLVRTLAERLALTGQLVSVALTGGTVGRSQVFDTAVRDAVRAALPSAQFAPLPNSPAEAAARLALAEWSNRRRSR